MPYIETQKKYKCIVADPPWKYYNKYPTAPKYPVLDVEEVKQLNVPDIADEDGCVLFLWVTAPLINNGLDVLREWSFTYKSHLVWIKTQWEGSGKWFQNNTELCLLGVKGHVKPFYVQKENVIYARPERFVRKPREFWDLIEPVVFAHQLQPGIELFAREQRRGWDTWSISGGNYARSENDRYD
jgi:N6-adenosine-specific RNA methylase IME4